MALHAPVLVLERAPWVFLDDYVRHLSVQQPARARSASFRREAICRLHAALRVGCLSLESENPRSP